MLFYICIFTLLLLLSNTKHYYKPIQKYKIATKPQKWFLFISSLNKFGSYILSLKVQSNKPSTNSKYFIANTKWKICSKFID